MSLLRSLRYLGVGSRAISRKRLASPRFRVEGLEERTVPTAIFTASNSAHMTPALAGDITSANPIDVTWHERTHVHVVIKVSGDELQWQMSILNITIRGVTVTTSGNSLTIDGVPASGTSVVSPQNGNPDGYYDWFLFPKGTAPGSMDEYGSLELHITVAPPGSGGGGGGGTPKTFNNQVVAVKVPAGEKVVPGQKLKVNLDLANSGTTACVGMTTAHITIDGETLDKLVKVIIPAGDTKTLGVTVTLPQLSLLGAYAISVGSHTIDATIDPITMKIGGVLTPETNTSDNSGTSTESIELAKSFGTIADPDGKKHNVKLKTKEGDVFSMNANGGVGTFSQVSPGVWDLTFTGTNEDSVASETGGRVPFLLHDVQADQAMDFFDMPDVVANGSLTFNGGLGALKLFALGDGVSNCNLTISAGFGDPALLQFYTISHANISAFDGVALLKTKEWLNPPGPSLPSNLTAPFINHILVGPIKAGLTTGDFEANIHTTGSNASDIALGKVQIAGAIRNATWQMDGAASNVDDLYAGAAQDWSLSAAGHVDKLTIGSDFINGDQTGSALEAGTFGNIKIGGTLSVGIIESTVADKHHIGINSFDVSRVAVLANLRAIGGGIQTINAKTWPAHSDVAADWAKEITIGTVGDTNKEFPSNLLLEKVRDATDAKSNYSLDSAVIHGKLGELGNALWTIYGNVRSLKFDTVDHWTFSPLSSNPVTIGTLRVERAFEHSDIRAANIGVIWANSFSVSSINVSESIGDFEMVASSAGAPYFTATDVTAGGTIHKVFIRNVDPMSLTCAFTAHEILAYTRYAGKDKAVGPIHYTTASTTLDSLFNFSVKIV